MAAQSLKNGLLLVGHGTRDARGLAEFEAVARQVAEMASEFLVEPCFLELAQPDIPTAVERLLQCGVRRLTVAPLLLFAAGHAKRDIPAAVDEAVGGRRQAVGGINHQVATGDRAAVADDVVIDQLPALECHERIVELSAQRYAEALAGRPVVDAADTLLLLVGRGSSDPQAIGAMQQFAALRAQRTAVGRVEVCFVAVAKPLLEEALDRAARSDFRRVVVQPHLLFTGEVLGEIGAVLRERGAGSYQAATGSRDVAADENKEWILMPHLGASPLVAQAVVELARGGKV
jgi:sirohydrochlorin ferrochelatase